MFHKTFLGVNINSKLKDAILEVKAYYALVNYVPPERELRISKIITPINDRSVTVKEITPTITYVTEYRSANKDNVKISETVKPISEYDVIRIKH